MNKKRWAALLGAAVAVAMLAAACAPAAGDESVVRRADAQVNEETAQAEEVQTVPQGNGFGALGALGDDELSLAEMLTYAVQDEYLAQKTYSLAIAALGEQTPFINIVKAEQTHINELLPLFEAYGIIVPENPAHEHAQVPESIAEAGRMGVAMEADNIAMYELFLRYQLPSDVRAVFEELKASSEKHHSSLMRVENRGSGQQGGGQGKGRGQADNPSAAQHTCEDQVCEKDVDVIDAPCGEAEECDEESCGEDKECDEESCEKEEQCDDELNGEEASCATGGCEGYGGSHADTENDNDDDGDDDD